MPSTDLPVGFEPMNEAYIVRSYQFSDLEGRILTILESLGIGEKQEQAAKSLMRQAIWKTPDRDFVVYEDEIAVALTSSRKKREVQSTEPPHNNQS